MTTTIMKQQKPVKGLECENYPLIALQNINKTFIVDKQPVSILNDITLQIEPGEYVGIIGKSGSGKSTLLNMITAIDKPTSGRVIVNGNPIHSLNESQSAVWRGTTIGIVFQFFQLLPTLSVLDNVMLPMDFCNNIPVIKRKNIALELLDRVGMQKHAKKLPTALSGGEQQRVAIARSLANDPPIIVADEPTGNLDTETTSIIHGFFKELADNGKTILMVTHDNTAHIAFNRIISISDGRVVNDIKRSML